ncbi:hypothetical protein [Paenibacillus sinopodophylli]|uniref:hypothetical protein n=1 Tax=Paenibacillus sinopodophylli TaxID=1837342 RepID=UPI00110CF019|nr:hypothetical protein [Paenibacillus sinopodophylli]
MEDKSKGINSIFKYLTQSNEGSPEFETFMAFLRGLKDYSSLLDIYDVEFIDHLLEEVLPKTNEECSKALIIETIVEATYGNAENNMLNELFHDYILLVERHATTIKNAAICLRGMIASGLSSRDVFVRIAMFQDKSYAVSLLTFINFHSWGELPSELTELQAEVDDAQKIRERSYIFTQFLVILHPFISKYQRVSSIDFVFDYEGAHVDWPFSHKGSALRLIKQNIIDEREGTIFEELGMLIHDESIDLHSIKVLNLYQALFDGRDPLNIIFTLPKG